MFPKIFNPKVSRAVHLFLLSLLISTGLSFGHVKSGSDSIPPDLLSAYDALLNLQLSSVETFLQAFQKKRLSHPFELYLINYKKVLDLYISGNEEAFKAGKKVEDEMLDKISAMDEDNKYKYFLKSEVRLQWAMAKLKFDSDFQALWGLRQAWLAARKGHELFPDFKPSWKAYGLLQVTFGTIPEKYQWLAGLLGLNGNVDIGMQYLNNLYPSNHFMARESGLLLAILYTYFYSDYYASEQYLDQLKDLMPESLLLVFLESTIKMKESKSAQALEILRTFEEEKFDGTTYPSIPFVHYMKGEIHLQQGRYKRAIELYRAFIDTHDGLNTIKDAQFKIAMCYWLLNDIEMAKAQLEVAANAGQTKNEADKNADQIIREGKLPNQTLLKIRYFTDGGCLDKADSLIAITSVSAFTDAKDKIEFMYRKARIAHKRGELTSAKKWYHKVIDTQGNESWYFAPNGCLQLGYIYTSEGNTIDARQYFERAGNYRGHAYVYSIRQKARLALDEMDKSH